MKLQLFLSIATLLPAMSSATIQAQSNGALKENLDFLKTKLETYLSYSVKGAEGSEVVNERFEALSFDSCRITWKSSMQTGASAELPHVMRNTEIENQVSVDLAGIDPSRTRIYVVENMLKRNLSRALILELKIRPGSPGFKHQMETNREGRGRKAGLEEKSYGFFFDVKDQSIAEQVSKAFAGASNICRGRVKRSP